MMEDEFDPHKPIYYGPSGSRKYKSGGTSEDIIILLVMLGAHTWGVSLGWLFLILW